MEIWVPSLYLYSLYPNGFLIVFSRTVIFRKSPSMYYHSCFFIFFNLVVLQTSWGVSDLDISIIPTLWLCKMSCLTPLRKRRSQMSRYPPKKNIECSWPKCQRIQYHSVKYLNVTTRQILNHNWKHRVFDTCNQPWLINKSWRTQ